MGPRATQVTLAQLPALSYRAPATLHSTVRGTYILRIQATPASGSSSPRRATSTQLRGEEAAATVYYLRMTAAWQPTHYWTSLSGLRSIAAVIYSSRMGDIARSARSPSLRAISTESPA